MSILIKGMEMPKSCRACMFAGYGGRTNELNVCMFNGHSQPTLSPERMGTCPLIPVPEHGPLFDINQLEKRQCYHVGEDGDLYKVEFPPVVWDKANLYEIPAVVPADKDGDT